MTPLIPPGNGFPIRSACSSTSCSRVSAAWFAPRPIADAAVMSAASVVSRTWAITSIAAASRCAFVSRAMSAIASSSRRPGSRCSDEAVGGPAGRKHAVERVAVRAWRQLRSQRDELAGGDAIGGREIGSAPTAFSVRFRNARSFTIACQRVRGVRCVTNTTGPRSVVTKLSAKLPATSRHGR